MEDKHLLRSFIIPLSFMMPAFSQSAWAPQKSCWFGFALLLLDIFVLFFFFCFAFQNNAANLVEQLTGLENYTAEQNDT